MAVEVSTCFWLMATLFIILYTVPAESRNDNVLTRPDPCNRYEVNGCSVGWFKMTKIVKRFTPACNRHDVCYSCGAGRNISRRECDEAFLEDMKRICYTGSVARGKRSAPNSMDAPPSRDFFKSSAQTLISNWQLFESVAENILGKDLSLLVHATDAEGDELVNKLNAVWTKMLSVLRDRNLSNQQALDLVHEQTTTVGSSSVVKRDDNSVNACLAAAASGHVFVRTFAYFHYDNPSKWFCRDDFVDDCLPK